MNGNKNGPRLNIATVSLLVGLAINLVALAYSYGAITERVANIEKMVDKQTTLLERYVFPQFSEPR